MAGEFGMVLRKFRRDAKLTLSEIASATGLTPSRICRYEMGKFIPGPENLIKLSKEYNVDINMLIEMANQAQKVNRAGKTIEPQKLIESLRKIDRNPNYRSNELSLNELKAKLNITDTNHADIGKQIRKKYGLSMTELAKGMGVSISLMSRIESGERHFTRRALSYLYRLENTEINTIDRKNINKALLPAKSFEEIYKETNAALPLSIPVYERLTNRIAKDYIFIHKKYTAIWGTNIIAISASNYLHYKKTIIKGDILLVSMDKKPNTDDLCIVTEGRKKYIGKYNNKINADYRVIFQIIRTIGTE